MAELPLIPKYIDYDMPEDWDAHGIGCWSLHVFESWEFVEKRSQHISLTERHYSDGHDDLLNFRKYLNRHDEPRYLMVEAKRCFENPHKKVTAYLTDEKFFRSFVDGMLKYGEIDEVDHDEILSNL